MKKLIASAFIALFPFFLFSEGQQDAKGSSGDGPVTVTINSRWSEDTPGARYYRNYLQALSNADDSITIIQDNINDETSYYDKLRTKFATGEFPNIFFDYGGARIKDYVESGILVDLEPYLNKDPIWKNGFYPVFEKWRFDSHSGIWGIPAEFYAVGIYYNKEIFKEVGVEIPKTMEEFEAVCDKLLKAGYIPMALGEKDIWRAGHFSNNLIMKAFGAQGVEDLAGRLLSYDDPDMIKIYTTIQNFNKKGFFGPNPVNMDYNMEKAAFSAEKTAMHMDGSWYLGEATESPIMDKIGVFPFPTINPEFAHSWQGGAAGGFSVVDTGEPKAIEASVRVIKAVSSAEYMKNLQLENKGGIYPVMFTPDKSVVSKLTIEYMDMTADAVEFRDDVQTYDSISSLLETVRLAIQGLFVGNTPQECADEIVSEIKNNG